MYSDRRCSGLSRLFLIGLLAVDLNAVGTAQKRCALFVPGGVASPPSF
jgi:hypothetical protein